MPIDERSLELAARRFADHLNQLLGRTITHAPMVPVLHQPSKRPEDKRMLITLREASQPGALLRTNHGPMRLQLAQLLRPEQVNGNRWRLRTDHYRYALEIVGAGDSWIRWEYERDRGNGPAYWSRNHAQGPHDMNLGTGSTINMNDLHLPTGWVAIEDVVRFCLNDLGVPPVVGGAETPQEWDEVLEHSLRTFHDDFAATPPGRPDQVRSD